MDLDSQLERLAAARGKAFWRGLEELAADAEFRAQLDGESALPADHLRWCPGREGPSRREFLTLAAASLALAGLSGCGVQAPTEKIVPYVRAPEELVPGKPQFYATAMPLCGIATGLLVESHEGRPTKVEGNESHPGSLGATDVFAQASVLSLYDPDRSQNVVCRGVVRTWEDAVAMLGSETAKARGRRGAGLAVLTEAVTSPTLVGQMEALLKDMPEAVWCQYEPAGQDLVHEGTRLALGEDASVIYRFDQAEVVLALDADFLTSGPGHLRYARDFINKRRGRPGPNAAATRAANRLYVIETTPTATGAKADHRWSLAAGRMEGLARALAVRLDPKLASDLGGRPPVPGGFPEARLDAIARDLRDHRTSCIVIAGPQQPPAVHLLAHAMNHALGNVGKTAVYTAPIGAKAGGQSVSLAKLTDEMGTGRIKTLVILGGNPAYNALVDLDFAARLQHVPLSVHLGLYADETARLCQWHIPEAHCLESWSDARAYDGTVSIVQPLIAPLFGGKTAHEVLVAMAGPPLRTSYEIVRDHWRQAWQQDGSPLRGTSELPKDDQGRTAVFERFWRRILHEGLIAGTALPPKAVALQGNWARALSTGEPRSDGSRGAESGSLEIVFRPDPAVFDGRFANNGWLQELPRVLTKLTWDNAALVSPKLAERLELKQVIGINGGEHGGLTVELVELQYGGRSLTAPAWILPGQADDSVTLLLGHGRTAAGRVGDGVGFSAYALRTAAAPWFDAGLSVRKAAGEHRLACTQYHHAMEDREPVEVIDPGMSRSAARADRSQPEVAARGPQLPSIYPEHPYTGYKWGMAIDLTACVGCNACVVACQAENNSPVVGKDQVYRGREMHWLRIDRYYRGDAVHSDHFETLFQPVPCMHCQNAPCELVCPVEATVHSDEGLNDMVYNRCVGTRYCSHNCPYKVRRFNFYFFSDYKTPLLKLARNPNVTVRSRGVMEKCTYCVQRISQARIRAEKGDRRVRDGEVLTACQAACPARAIVFGNLNDPGSEVVRWKSDARNYELLAELNTRPRTTYLGVLRNPNPEIEAT